MKKTYAIINYGCQMNESDSEHYAGQLLDWAMRPVRTMNMPMSLLSIHAAFVKTRKKDPGKDWGNEAPEA